MADKDKGIEWLVRQTEEYRSSKNGTEDVVDDLDDMGKLGWGFSLVDELEEINIGDGSTGRPMYVNANLSKEQKEEVRALLRELTNCFTWEYTDMPGLSRELVEHRLPIKPGFRPYRQPTRSFNAEVITRVKNEVEWFLDAGFIQPCRYAEWVSNIIPVEKKGTGKIRVCVDFRNMNWATTKDGYPMPIADVLVNNASGHKVISFLDGNAGYNQIFMAKEDMHKTAFRCSRFVGLFKWIMMTFGMKNAGATYQRAMNLIFHDLLGVILEIYIDDVVVKSADFREHMADLRILLERMRKFGLKMNPLKCMFSVSVGWFLGFIVHAQGIQVDPKKVEAISRMKEPTCKRDV
jgi:hypothetical protein